MFALRGRLGRDYPDLQLPRFSVRRDERGSGARSCSSTGQEPRHPGRGRQLGDRALTEVLIGSPSLSPTLIHRSAWKGYSANFACTEFSEVRKSALNARCDTPREVLYWHA